MVCLLLSLSPLPLCASLSVTPFSLHSCLWRVRARAVCVRSTRLFGCVIVPWVPWVFVGELPGCRFSPMLLCDAKCIVLAVVSRVRVFLRRVRITCCVLRVSASRFLRSYTTTAAPWRALLSTPPTACAGGMRTWPSIGGAAGDFDVFIFWGSSALDVDICLWDASLNRARRGFRRKLLR